MATLYEISAAMRDVIQNSFHINEETGEVFEPEDLDALECDLNEKLEACALYIKNELADAEAISYEEQQLAKRRQAKENHAKRLKDYVVFCMAAAEQRKLETSKVVVSMRKSEIVEVDTDNFIIPDAFMNKKVSMTPNKTAIKNAIKSGESIDGCALIEKQYITIK